MPNERLQRIDLARADKLADDFAACHKRNLDDTIVTALRRDLRRAFGLERYRNRMAAQKREIQPDLFPTVPARVIEIVHKAEATNA